MNKNIILSIAVLSLLILSGCSEENVKEQSEISKLCTADWSPVCGVDGETYANKCTADNVEIVYEGECKETHTCTTEEKENNICTREYMPVCGNDDVTYATGCTGCSAGIDSYIDGKCPAHVCTEEEKQAEICTSDYTPVCGNDKLTYGNSCSACSSGKIESWIQGEC